MKSTSNRIKVESQIKLLKQMGRVLCGMGHGHNLALRLVTRLGGSIMKWLQLDPMAPYLVWALLILVDLRLHLLPPR